MAIADAIAQGLQTAGAAYNNKLPEFYAQQDQQKAQQAADKESSRNELVVRDLGRTYALLKEGQFIDAMDIIGKKRAELADLGADTTEQDKLLTLIDQAADGDKKSLTRALTNVGAVLEEGYITGRVKRPPEYLGKKDNELTYMGKKVKSTNFLPGGAVQYTFSDGPPVVIPPDEASQRALDASYKRAVEYERKKNATTQGARSEAKEVSKQYADAVTIGSDALDTYQEVIKAEEILRAAETGGLAKAVVDAKNFFGVGGDDVRDFGSLQNIMGNVVLNRLQKFKGQMSEKELDFSMDTSAWVDRNAASNLASLGTIKDDLRRAIAKGQWAATKAKTDYYKPIAEKLGQASQFYDITPYGKFVSDPSFTPRQQSQPTTGEIPLSEQGLPPPDAPAPNQQLFDAADKILGL